MIISSSFKGPFTISKPLQSVDCFSHILSTFQFVLNHRVSYTHDWFTWYHLRSCEGVCVWEHPLWVFEVVCEASESVSAASVPNCGFRLYLAFSVYLSPSPQPSQNAYINAPSLAAFPREKGVTAATPTGVTEHPAPCQPTLQPNPRPRGSHTRPQTARASWNFLLYQRWWRTSITVCTVCIYICF